MFSKKHTTKSVAFHSTQMTFDFMAFLHQMVTCIDQINIPVASIAGIVESAYEEVVNGVLKRGYLVKKGGKRRNWKRRWFVLKNDEMSYYESCENLTLKVCMYIHMCITYWKINNHKYCNYTQGTNQVSPCTYIKFLLCNEMFSKD